MKITRDDSSDQDVRLTGIQPIKTKCDVLLLNLLWVFYILHKQKRGIISTGLIPANMK